MKIHEPATMDGFFLQILRALDDIEDEKIREYQEANRGKMA